DILANITAIENLARQLKDLEENDTEIQIANKVVSILPQHYGHFKLWWDNLDEDQQTTDLLTTRLLSEERRIGKPSTEKPDTSNLTETAFSSTHSNQKFKRGSYRNSGSIRGSYQNRNRGWKNKANIYCDFHNSTTHSSQECRTNPRN
ncbi:Uncharacterized protein APZ42_007810, partial [Daphnia magna]